jgi:hypothetical protein
VKTRLWLIYLAGVSIGFERGGINVFQTLASKRRRGGSGVPLSRADLYRLVRSAETISPIGLASSVAVPAGRDRRSFSSGRRPASASNLQKPESSWR